MLLGVPRALSAAGVLFVVLGAAGCDLRIGDGNFQLDVASGAAQDEWQKAYTVPAGGRFEVRNQNGDVTVEPGSGPAVEVTAERRVRASSDEEAQQVLKGLEVVEQVGSNGVSLEMKAPSGGVRRGLVVKYVVKVPKGVVVHARTVNGAVRLTDLPNDVVAETQNGPVRADGLSGAVEASTTNGGVDVSLAGLADAGVKLETVNGRVSLALPRDARADISARVVNGGISTSDLQIERVGDQDRRRLEGRLNGGGPKVEVATTNGGVSLRGRA